MLTKGVLFALLVLAVISSDVFDQFGPIMQRIIDQSKVEGATIRECTCEEQNDCLIELKGHGLTCAEGCWDKLKGKFSKPDEVKKCLMDKDVEAAMFFDCFEEKADTCVKTRGKEQVPKHDIEKMLDLFVAHFKSKANKVANSLSTPIQQLVGVSEEFGTCVKSCIQDKNKAQGFCFDQKKCQLKLDIPDIKSSLKKCTQEQNWKDKAEETCKCLSKAGISEIESICPLVKAAAAKVKD
ncbi:unnamed protein product [Bursaphelenchus okinawaensis]|uniref:Uncharacterized protein n=1 Tax=Bursaphelenchus okinawaensis TaxID=465554 RepID=A0A811KV95_9BILA|nr:unnamed protein product [Bursaphelenchus okinawaensis]CAG9112820.1 unnamed protein product [Bursaphelenchus okinawaensis]